ncbi:MAG TPA: hypothetical protein VHH32_08615 [Gemmatimonadales bacterium]|nr:hypothetical protein [Gemmatimonadales bacterium]
MIRRVAFRKAVLAGVIGALAWEAVIRGLIVLGLPLGDLVHLLGTMVVPHSPAWIWWPAGLALHATVGAIWAIFYAYFFWSTFEWSPATQGLVFTGIPILLAGMVMLPQLGWMHPLVLQGEFPHPGVFWLGAGWGGLVSIVLGHLVYGATMGSLYTRPVGYAVQRRPVFDG